MPIVCKFWLAQSQNGSWVGDRNSIGTQCIRERSLCNPVVSPDNAFVGDRNSIATRCIGIGSLCNSIVSSDNAFVSDRYYGLEKVHDAAAKNLQGRSH